MRPSAADDDEARGRNEMEPPFAGAGGHERVGGPLRAIAPFFIARKASLSSSQERPLLDLVRFEVFPYLTEGVVAEVLF